MTEVNQKPCRVSTCWPSEFCLLKKQIQAKNFYLYHFFPEIICFAVRSCFAAPPKFTPEVCGPAEGVLGQGTTATQTAGCSSPQPPRQRPGRASTEQAAPPAAGQPHRAHGLSGVRNTYTHRYRATNSFQTNTCIYLFICSCSEIAEFCFRACSQAETLCQPTK